MNKDMSKKIPFDVKFRPQIESGEYKVETELGNPAIVMDWGWNWDGEKCLAVKVPGFGRDNALLYHFNGKRASVFPPEEGSNLFIVTPEPELTDFEKAVKDLCWKVGMGEVVYKDDIIKKTAAELFDLARKEIMDGWNRGLRDTQDCSGKAYNDGYQLGLEKGKAEALKEIEQDPESSYAFKRGVEYGKEEALKELPMWKKIKAFDVLPCRAYLYNLAYERENNFGGSTTIHGLLIPNDTVKVGCDTWYLPVDDIQNLPKED